MDKNVMVAKLSARAKVTEDEARRALEACEWDVLDAMVYLEMLGKTPAPEKETYTTGSEEQDQTPSVRTIVDDQNNRRNNRRRMMDDIGRGGRKIWQKLRDNSFHVSRRGDEIIKMPAFVLVLALLCFWKILLPLMLVGMIFGIRYSFSGKDNLDKANEMMDKAGHLADEVVDKIKNEL